jgi:hypothetical protein
MRKRTRLIARGVSVRESALKVILKISWKEANNMKTSFNNLRKWRLALALAAIVAFAGIAWAAGFDFPGNLTVKVLPLWAAKNIFGETDPSNLGNVHVYPPENETHGNVVTIGGNVDGLVGGATNGAFTGDTDVSNNSVIVDTNGITIKVAVIGAGVQYGNATGNNVTINHGTIGSGTPTEPGQVFGGYVTGGSNGGTSGNAERNTVTVTGGTINDHVFGGLVQGPAGTSNINPGWRTTGDGNAINNTVEIKGGELKKGIFGGRAYAGDAKNNQIKLSGTANLSAVEEIIGGSSVSGNATANSVDIAVDIKIKGDIVGGRTDGGAANGNTVTINKGKIEDNNNNSKLFISGGNIENTIGSKSANENKVIIKGNRTTKLIGGTDDSGALNVVGARGLASNKAENNRVEISGYPEFTGHVNLYGAYLDNGIGTTKNNVVQISDYPDFSANVSLYGGIGTTATGNKLILKADEPLTVNSVQNFQEYDITIPSTVGNGGSVLIVNGTANLGTSAPTIKVSNVALAKNEYIYLISAGTLTQGGFTASSITATAADGKAIQLALAIDSNKLKATRPNDGTLDVPDIDFGTLPKGYGVTTKPVVVNLEGDWKTGVTVSNAVLSGAEAANFNISKTGSTYAVSPDTGLDKGSYSGTITVTLSNGVTKTATVKLTVGDPTSTPVSRDVITVEKTDKIASVTVSGDEVIVTYTDGTAPVTYDMDTKQVNIDYKADVFEAISTSASAKGTVIVVASGDLIPSGTAVSIDLTLTSLSTARLAKVGDKFTVAGTVRTANKKTTVEIPLSKISALSAGTYDITLKSAKADANPYFTVTLAKGFVVTSSNTDTGTDTGGDTDTGDDDYGYGRGGGCDSGLGALAGVLAAGALVKAAKLGKKGKKA